MLSRVAVASVLIPSIALAQTTTNCTTYIPNQVNCTTTAPIQTVTQPQSGVDWQGWGQIYQQQQQQMNQSMRNLGLAIAAERERSRQKKVLEQVKAALASDPATAEPPPADEQPVLLACTLAGGGSVSIALYEKHGRADVTSGGITKTRAASFSNDAVTWTSPIFRVTLSRLDGSLTGIGTIPVLDGYTQNGSCQVAQRKF